MPSASKSTTLYSSNGSGYTLNAYFVENSTSTANNTSNITCRATITSQGASWSSSYNSTLVIYWYDNRERYDRYVASINLSSLGVGASATAQGTINVTHNDDGSLAGHAYAYFTQGSSSGGWCPASGGIWTDDVALTKIPRAATISSIGRQARPIVSHLRSVSIKLRASFFIASLLSCVITKPSFKNNY